MVKDYYDLLGVPKDADPKTIKTAYRRKAREYHPDVTKDPDGETKFKELGEAYDVLKDPNKKSAYDRYGTTSQRPSYRHTTQHTDIEELLRRAQEVHQQQEAEYRKNPPQTIQKISIPVNDMIAGGQVTFRFLTERPATNYLSSTFHYSLASTVLKPNTKVGTRIRIKNIPNTTFMLLPSNSPGCIVQGLDIIVPFDANALAVAIGNKCKVLHPNGKTYEVAVPIITKSGNALRLPKLGLTHVNGAVGSLLAVVNYVIPPLSEKEQEALKKLLNDA